MKRRMDKNNKAHWFLLGRNIEEGVRSELQEPYWDDFVFEKLADRQPSGVLARDTFFYETLSLYERQTIFYRLRLSDCFRKEVAVARRKTNAADWPEIQLLCLGAGVTAKEFLGWDSQCGDEDRAVNLSRLLRAPGPRPLERRNEVANDS